MSAHVKLSAAKWLAARGLPLFPLLRRKKLPAVSGWQQAATTDEAKLAKWFSDDRYNIGVFTGRDLIVVDCDRKAEDGDENIRRIAGKHVAGLDNTFTVETPSGGRHYYFRGGVVRNSVHRLAPAVDIRSRGGLVVGPGSDRADGKSYRVINDADIQPVPQWLTEAISATYVKTEPVKLEAPVDLDTPAAIAMARAYLKDVEPAIEGQGGNDLTYRTACRIKDFGVSESMAYTLMGGAWNARCEPPWEEDELADVISHAYAYGENSPGVVQADLEAWFDVLPDLEPRHKAGAANDNVRLTRMLSRDCYKKRLFFRPNILKGVLARKDYMCVFGQPGAGKSLFGPYVAYSVARGRERAFGRRVKRGRILYVAVEDHDGMAQRISVLHARLGDAGENFVLIGGISDLQQKENLRELKAEIKTVQPDIVVIDTLARAFPNIEENSTEDMGGVVNQTCRALTRVNGAAVILIHHTPKDGTRTPRGSSALLAEIDVGLFLTKADGAGEVHGELIKNRNGALDWFPRFKIGIEELGKDEDGDMRTAAYAVELASRKSGTDVHQKLTGSEKAALEKLDDLGGRASFEEWREACIGGRTGVSMADKRDDRRSVFSRAVRGLKRKKLIDLRDHGETVVALPELTNIENLFDDVDDAAWSRSGSTCAKKAVAVIGSSRTKPDRICGQP